GFRWSRLNFDAVSGVAANFADEVVHKRQLHISTAPSHIGAEVRISPGRRYEQPAAMSPASDASCLGHSADCGSTQIRPWQRPNSTLDPLADLLTCDFEIVL